VSPHTNPLPALEQAYDQFPRAAGAPVESIGPFEVFGVGSAGWPYYARPRLGTTVVNVTDVNKVRARQRELGNPEAFEWVHETTPALLDAVRASGLPVLLAPLMVRTTAAPAPVPDGARVRLLEPDDPGFARDFAIRSAVADLGFGNGGTAAGPVGPAERDRAVVPTPPGRIAYVAAAAREGVLVHAVAETEDGIVATGAIQLAPTGAEVVGVATLPSARRRGLAAALSDRLARYAEEHGSPLVFLSAEDDAVARVYARCGFVRVGTACIAEPHS
jgi:GNAT superfamily N-acetyltransferase